MKKIYLAGVVLIALTASLAVAQTGEDIVNKHIQASGGIAKYKAINTKKVTGTFSMPAMGVEMTYTSLQKRGNKLIIRSSSDQFGSVVNACDGKTCWMINPFAGAAEATEMPPAQASQFMLQANIDGFFLNRDKSGIKLEYLGQEELGGANYNKVKIDYPGDIEQIAYFDVSTGLLIQMESTSSTGSSTTIVSDYREEDGILSAHRIDVTTPQMGITITIDAVEYNITIDDSEFAMPAAEK